MWYWAKIDLKTNDIKSVCKVYTKPIFSEERKKEGFKEISQNEYEIFKKQLKLKFQQKQMAKEKMELLEIQQEQEQQKNQINYETISNE